MHIMYVVICNNISNIDFIKIYYIYLLVYVNEIHYWHFILGILLVQNRWCCQTDGCCSNKEACVNREGILQVQWFLASHQKCLMDRNMRVVFKSPKDLPFYKYDFFLVASQLFIHFLIHLCTSFFSVHYVQSSCQWLGPR